MKDYNRILLKLSGEILLGEKNFGIDKSKAQALATALKNLKDCSKQIGVVIGGGNIYRGVDLCEEGFSRTSADQLGMLATIFNGIALQQALNGVGIKSVVMSALDCPKIVESYNWGRAMDSLDKGELLIFVGGTGNPYFTTDSAGALRACEIEAEIFLKATKVNGVYNKDPKKYPDARMFDRLSYSQFLTGKLQVMDATAVTLCENGKIPIFVFNMKRLFESSPKDILNLNNGTLVE